MARILALDYGKKRTGIAVTDSLQIIANSLTTIETIELLDFLKKYIAKEDVEAIVMGLPVDLQNNKTDATQSVRTFAKKLEIAFPDKRLHFYDERFTSKMALQTLIDAGTTKKYRKDKGNIDKISATIILQDWMERNSKK